MPRLLDLADQTLFALFGAFLDFLALATKVGLQAVGIPVLVWSCDVGVPVVLHKILEVLAICGSGIWDVMIGEPSLEFSLMPFVVC